MRCLVQGPERAGTKCTNSQNRRSVNIKQEIQSPSLLFPHDFQIITFSLYGGATITWSLISVKNFFWGWAMETWLWIMKEDAKHLQQPNCLEPQNSLSILFKQWISWEFYWGQHESDRYDGSFIIFKFVSLWIKSVPQLLLISGTVYFQDFHKPCICDLSVWSN